MPKKYIRKKKGTVCDIFNLTQNTCSKKDLITIINKEKLNIKTYHKKSILIKKIKEARNKKSKRIPEYELLLDRKFGKTRKIKGTDILSMYHLIDKKIGKGTVFHIMDYALDQIKPIDKLAKILKGKENELIEMKTINKMKTKNEILEYIYFIHEKMYGYKGSDTKPDSPFAYYINIAKTLTHQDIINQYFQNIKNKKEREFIKKYTNGTTSFYNSTISNRLFFTNQVDYDDIDEIDDYNRRKYMHREFLYLLHDLYTDLYDYEKHTIIKKYPELFKNLYADYMLDKFEDKWSKELTTKDKKLLKNVKKLINM